MQLRGLLLLLCTLVSLPVLAQEADDRPVDQFIAPEQTVTETINDTAIFDWWRISLNEGDILVVEMQASDGLSPLIGLLDSDMNLLARSDEARPPEPNTLAILQYEAESSGEYRIIATREGNAEGTTTGSYTLTAFIAPPPNQTPLDQAEVEFRCDEMLVTTAAIIEFNEEIRQEPPDGIFELYRLSVFGLDGFQPVIRAESRDQTERLDCSDDAQRFRDSSITLPGEETITFDDADQAFAAQLTLRNTAESMRFGQLRLTIGSRDGAPGRYIAVLEGLALNDRRDHDLVQIITGPLTRTRETLIYMVADGQSRLNPVLSFGPDEDTVSFRCDDAGIRDCEDIPAFEDAGAVLMLDQAADCPDDDPDCDTETRAPLSLTGDRFDAGIRLAPDTTEPVFLQLESRNQDTDGRYTLYIIGTLPGD